MTEGGDGVKEKIFACYFSRWYTAFDWNDLIRVLFGWIIIFVPSTFCSRCMNFYRSSVMCMTNLFKIKSTPIVYICMYKFSFEMDSVFFPLHYNVFHFERLVF